MSDITNYGTMAHDYGPNSWWVGWDVPTKDEALLWGALAAFFGYGVELKEIGDWYRLSICPSLGDAAETISKWPATP